MVGAYPSLFGPISEMRRSVIPSWEVTAKVIVITPMMTGIRSRARRTM